MGSDRAGALTGAALGPGAQLRALAAAMRPFQWPKNFIVFAALLFSVGDAWTPRDPATWQPLAGRAALLFAAWCLVASGMYLVNDLRDAPFDRYHPRKRLRPLAAGDLSPGLAALAAVVLTVAGIAAGFAASWAAGAMLAGYAAGMLAYTFALKAMPVLDVVVLSAGVVLRAAGGAVAVGVAISPWLYVCSAAGAWFLAVSKRWAEARALGEEAGNHRPALAKYPPIVLDQMLAVSAGSALVSYALYSIESANVPANGAMALTVPFVAFAIFRYLYLLAGPRASDPPDRILFTDPAIVGSVLGFVATAVTVLAIWG